jgi:hypothetical protein
MKKKRTLIYSTFDISYLPTRYRHYPPPPNEQYLKKIQQFESCIGIYLIEQNAYFFLVGFMLTNVKSSKRKMNFLC